MVSSIDTGFGCTQAFWKMAHVKWAARGLSVVTAKAKPALDGTAVNKFLSERSHWESLA